MSNALFPVLPGFQWNRLKTPTFATKVQASVSFMELRAAFAPYPQWKWTLSYEFLRQTPTFPEFQTLADFFLARLGMFDSFLYDDLSDNTATAMRFGTGNAVTTTFQLLRTFSANGFAEYVYNLNGAPQIFNNGVLLTAGIDYTIANGLVTFASAPANTHALTWTGQYLWRVRFDQDSTDFNLFSSNFWEAKQVTFVSVLGS